MPLTYEVPLDVRHALEEALAAPPSEVLSGVLAVVAGLGIDPDADLMSRLRAVLAYRSRGPAEIWHEMVDTLNAAEGPSASH